MALHIILQIWAILGKWVMNHELWFIPTLIFFHSRRRGTALHIILQIWARLGKWVMNHESWFIPTLIFFHSRRRGTCPEHILMVFILLNPTLWEEIANTQHENPTPVPHTAARFARWDQNHFLILKKLKFSGKILDFLSYGQTCDKIYIVDWTKNHSPK